MSSPSKPQRVVVGMLDGLGVDYLEASPMPEVRALAARGLHRTVQAVFPTVTNVNNVSICCGAWPSEHHIIANSYYDPSIDGPRYMNAAELVAAPTLFERAARHGVRSALLTSKRKTVELLHRGAEIAVAAECPPDEWLERLGPPAPIYSAEINEWLWSAAIAILRDEPEIGLLYVHTTDYPMHMWAPEEAPSLEHLARVDARIGEASRVAPDAAFLLTADHGMNAKARCWDLSRVLADAGCPARFVLSPERDYYIRHHRNFAGCSFVWLADPADAPRVRATILALEGVEGVLDRPEAAARFHLEPTRIGDLVVLGDARTVFGELESPREDLALGYRNHGSLHEMTVPLIVSNWRGDLPAPETFRANKDLAAWLYT